MSNFQTERSLFDAAIESANIFNGAANECAATSSLFKAVENYSTVDGILKKMGFVESKKETLKNFLDVLIHTRRLECRKHNNVTVYKTAIKDKGSLSQMRERYKPKEETLKSWFGEEHTELIRSANKDFFGADLSFFRSETQKIRFHNSFLKVWQKNLMNPLYEFGRLIAVKELVRRGNRFLDLACGLGYGIQRLAEYSNGETNIIGIDKSSDFLNHTRYLILPKAKVTLIERDLNTGLPPLAKGWFDGILFNGAFHFIRDKTSLLNQMWDVLRPGGLLVIGHCFCQSCFEDEAMHKLYFSMLENPIWLISFKELQALISEVGFKEIHQYHRGSHSYIIAERIPHNPIKE